MALRINDASEDSGHAPAESGAVKPPETVVPFRSVGGDRAGEPVRSERRQWLRLAAALAVMVFGTVFMLWEGDPQWPELYTAELRGALRDTGSPESAEAAGPSIFEVGGPFELLLRPKQPLEEDSAIDFYLQSEDGEIVPWSVGYSKSAEGVVKIEGTIGGEVVIGPGTWTLWVVYGKPGRLPRAESLGSDTPEATARWRVLRFPLRIVGSIQASSNGRWRSPR